MRSITSTKRYLKKRINGLLDACNQGKGKEEVGRVINFLDDFITRHFGAEERLMIQYDYPEYNSHKLLHTQFIKDFSDLKRQIKEEGICIHIVKD